MAATGQAIRDFTDACNNPESKFYAHPEDYTLMHIGEYDDSLGKMFSPEVATALGRGIDFKTPQPIPPMGLQNGTDDSEQKLSNVTRIQPSSDG
mgnify:CR=1 FL=1